MLDNVSIIPHLELMSLNTWFTNNVVFKGVQV
jgi:hypothetical protein